MSQRESVPDQSARLWACHSCELIGGREEAETHERMTSWGCVCVELDQETSDAIRAEWRKQQATRVVGLLALAKSATRDEKRQSDGR